MNSYRRSTSPHQLLAFAFWGGIISAFSRRVSSFAGQAGTSTASAFTAALVATFTAAAASSWFSHFLPPF
jgi:hypothetical protein